MIVTPAVMNHCVNFISRSDVRSVMAGCYFIASDFRFNRGMGYEITPVSKASIYLSTAVVKAATSVLSRYAPAPNMAI